jgi:hypothetical protein
VLGADLSGCAENAVRAFFDDLTVARCTKTARVVPPPAAPDSLRALSGRTTARRTLNAVIATLTGLRYDYAAADLSGELGLGASFGGVRGGYADYGVTSRLHDYSDVPGVTLTGTLRSNGSGLLHIGGRGARGTLHLTRTRIYGVLSRRRISAELPGERAFLTAVRSALTLPARPHGPIFP